MKTFAAILFAAVAVGAQAQSCVPREYAQHLQDAKTGSGRINEAFTFCRSKTTAGMVGASKAEVCEAEAQKAFDAMQAAKDNAAVSFALAGCKGDMPAKKR